MPTIADKFVLTGTSVDVLNAIRNNSTQNYQNFIPIATPDAESIKGIGAIIMQYPSLQNEFLNSLVNRVGRVMLSSKTYDNPWKMFKKGLLDFGETIEEIFVNIAKPYSYDPETAETTLFKREIPDVRAAFHVMNYQKLYQTTVNNDQLRQAFLSWQGITDLISKIVDSMYTAANYDEFLTMKYMLAKHILAGHMYPVSIGAATAENAKAIVSTIKQISNDMEFMQTTYNLSGVENFSTKPDQYILINAKFDAIMDVEVLASAFNLDKVEFMGHRVLVDSFGKLDNKRLALLFANDPTYTELSADQLSALDAIPAIIVDKNWFMIFDNFFNMTEQYNGKGLYWNYFYHTWKTFSISPFANNALFVPGTPAITSVTVSPATATVAKGKTANFAATVVTANFAPMGVNWTINSTKSSIDNSGNLTVSATETATTITVTATSVYDGTKTGTATVTVG